jgi:arginase
MGLVARLRQASRRPVEWRKTIRAPDSASPAAARVAEFCGRLAHRVGDCVRGGEQFVVVGGDHSCAIGTWSGAWQALRARGPLGLLWIDAHMDSHIPATTPSGALHGMPLASLLGFGDPALVHLVGRGPKLEPAHIALVGVRSFEADEAELVARLGVRVYMMEEVRSRGLARVMAEAVERVRTGTAGYGLSLDIDVVDPAEAPAVDTPASGGLSGRELVDALRGLGCDERLIGAELVELNPGLDPHDVTVRLGVELLSALFTEPRVPEHLHPRYAASRHAPREDGGRGRAAHTAPGALGDKEEAS